MDTAVAYNESYKIKVVTFADKMRNVAVTDGDKIEAQIQLGWTVDYWCVGDLVEYVNAVDETKIDKLYAELQDKYNFISGDNSPEKFEHNVKYQIREYLAIKKFMDEKGYSALNIMLNIKFVNILQLKSSWMKKAILLLPPISKIWLVWNNCRAWLFKC